MAGAFHHGLRAGEFQVRIEAVDHGMVAVAMDEIAQIGKAEVLVELGITAARDIEVEPVVAGRDHVDIETAAAGPDFFRDIFERTQVTTKSFGPPRAILDGK